METNYVGKFVQIVGVNEGKISFLVLDPEMQTVFTVDAKKQVLLVPGSVRHEKNAVGMLYLLESTLSDLKIPQFPGDLRKVKTRPELGGEPGEFASAPNAGSADPGESIILPPKDPPRPTYAVVHSVDLTIVRDKESAGPQLTKNIPYLLLAGRDSCVARKIDLDHDTLLEHLEEMRFHENGRPDARRRHVDALQDAVTRFLENIEGWQPKKDSSDYLHVRLAIEANELAMVPFELVRSKGSSPPLLVDAREQVVFTREVRSIERAPYRWPSAPKILFAWANLGSLPSSAPAHKKELERALRPWARPIANGGALQPDFDSLLTILPEASLEEIQEAFWKERYTHVHIAGHGAPQYASGKSFFGIALRNSAKNGSRVVGGQELIHALTAPPLGAHRPVVVTLATCDSAHDAAPSSESDSVAQVLHSAGFPFVLGTQFAIAVSSAARIFGEFYSRILVGEDPRIALYHARLVAKGAHKDREDWASLVAYSSFPDDLTEQMRELELSSIMSSLQVAGAWADAALKLETEDAVQAARARIDEVIDRLQWLETGSGNASRKPSDKWKAEHRGLFGSAYKRKAALMHGAILRCGGSAEGAGKEALRWLEHARNKYAEGHNEDPTNHWTGVQHLALDAVLTGDLVGQNERLVIAEFFAKRACLLSEEKKDADSAHGSLAELCLLRLLLEPDRIDEKVVADCVREAARHLEFTKNASARHIASTKLQLTRYVEWWPALAPVISPSCSLPICKLKKAAETLVAMLP